MKPYLSEVKSRLDRHFVENAQKKIQWEGSLFQDFLYVMGNGGKAARPAILHLFYSSLSGNQNSWPEFVLDAGLALEMVHSYSLVHDDLPCMDDDDFRRGRLSLHRYKNEERAVLVGDALLTGAFELLSENPQIPDRLALLMVRELSRAAGARGMIYGQCLDVGDDQSVFEDLQKLNQVHDLKTGALFGAACAMGALCAAHSRPALLDEIDEYRDWGVRLGRLFQIVDDVHDEGPYLQILGLSKLKQECQKISDDLSSRMSKRFLSGHQKLEEALDFFVHRDS